MNFTETKVTEIYFIVDEFCKEFGKELSNHVVGNVSKRPPTLSFSEVMAIMILFHDKGYRCMKHFFTRYVQKQLTEMFRIHAILGRGMLISIEINISHELKKIENFSGENGAVVIFCF